MVGNREGVRELRQWLGGWVGGRRGASTADSRERWATHTTYLPNLLLPSISSPPPPPPTPSSLPPSGSESDWGGDSCTDTELEVERNTALVKVTRTIC